VLAGENHILDAFRLSVHETMQDIEAEGSMTRVRRGGKDQDRRTGSLLWADFVHQTARPVDGEVSDPHLHCHCFTFNLTHDPVENRMKAAQFGGIKRDINYYQARFHARLSDRLIQLGYEIRRTRTMFEVVGIPKEALDLFSKRSQVVQKFIRDNNITDPKEKSEVAARTRSRKQKGLTMSQLKTEWRKQIVAMGVTREGDNAIRYAKDRHYENVTAAECIDHALLHNFERLSVVDERRVLTTAYRQKIGRVGPSVEAITNEFKEDSRILRVKRKEQTFITTQEVLAEERRLVSLIHKGKGKLNPIYASVPFLSLTDGQADAARQVLTSRDRVNVIMGKAGTGKTTMMTETVRLMEAAGYPVTVVAPTAFSSRGVLRQEGFKEAETVAKLLCTPEMQRKLQGGVLWIDEAGLLGVADMLALLRLATKYKARLICSGDFSQHSSVIRGDALRVITEIANVRPAMITKIFRQKSQVYREAVEALSTGDIHIGFSKLESIGAIRELPSENPYDELADAYISVLKRKKTALVICPTHAQGSDVTQAIREKLRASGMLDDKETTFSRLAVLSMTVAEKQDVRNYQPGLVLQFSQNRKGIKRGSRWSVASCTPKELLLTNIDDDMISFPPEKAEDFEVYQQTTIDLAKGDLVRITRNGFDTREKRLNNGQLLKVAGFDKKGQLLARHPDGTTTYTLGQEFGHLAYAHCLTSHASQGKTVDEVFIAQPASSFPACDLKQFYVSVSRGREKVHIMTDDKEGLLEHASDMRNREAALELMRQYGRTMTRHAVRKQGYTKQPQPTP
jgi:ATP-dependent exoDNAse (exonuclease V) alpha subunit